MSGHRSWTVAIVSTQAGWHGGEEQARLLAEGLRRRGHRCVLIARRGAALAQRAAAEGIEVVDFPGVGRTPWAIWQIRRHLRRLRPTVLHSNDSHAMVAAGLASLGQRIPVRVVSRRLDFSIREPWRYRWFADRVICVSRAVAEACAAGGIPRDRLRVVHDGVDPARVASGDRARGRRVLGASANEMLLLTVAKLTDHKGHISLLEAMPAILARNPRVRLLLAGDGELRGKLEADARRLGIEGQVRFLGYRNDVPDLIHAADLFVFPSHKEGMGSSLVDVMLAGVPIVTTTAGGIPDVTGSAEPDAEPSVWAVPPRNPGALADAVNEALASPDRCAEYVRRARDRAIERFTADRMVESTLAVYRGQ